MSRSILLCLVGIATVCLVLQSCKRDDGITGPNTPTGPSLTASPSGVSVSSGQTRNVLIYGGTNPYSITQTSNQSLATAQISNPAQDTIVVVISGAITTATGSTSIVVKDASMPQKSVTVGITKLQ
jgi:hypothetical protein